MDETTDKTTDVATVEQPVAGTLDRPDERVSAPGDGHVLAVPSWLDQDEVLRDLWGKQMQPAEIAEKLNRSVAAVMTRAARLGLPRRFAPGRKAGQRYEKIAPAAGTSKRGTRAEAVRTEGFGEADEVAENPNMAERVCLMCLRKFKSEGRHNRICPSCKGSTEYIAGSRIPDIHVGSGL